MEANRLQDTAHEETGLHVSPDPVTFGTICHGYTYTMDVRLQNHTRNSVRVKAEISPLRLEDEKNEASLSYVPIQIAPGMSTTMSIRINCNYTGTCKYKFSVYYGLHEKFELHRTIVAYVLSLEMFKNMVKQLAVHNKKVLLDNVSSLSRVPGGSQFFSGTRSPGQLQLEASAATAGSSTIHTADLLDNDDIDDLSEIPRMPYVYWDLTKGRMFLDKKLLEIVIDPSADLSASKKLTRDRREVRYNEIEEQGCYTKRGIEAIVQGRGSVWANDIEGATRVDTVAASTSDPYTNVALKESSGSTVETDATKENPYGHIRGSRALGHVNGKVPSTKPSRNKSIGAMGMILSPTSPKGRNVTF